MKDILASWLQDEVGVIVDFDVIDNTLKDGMLFIKIFKYYDAINVSSIKNVFPSEDINVCRNNLKQLQIWFRLLDINFTNDIIAEIINGNASLCINILYQLYLIFNMEHLNLVSKQKERAAIKESGSRFKVSQLSSSKIDSMQVPTNVNVYRYNDKIWKNKDVISWYRDKHGKRIKKWTCVDSGAPVRQPDSKESIRNSQLLKQIKLNSGSELSVTHSKNTFDVKYIHKSVEGDNIDSSSDHDIEKSSKCSDTSGRNVHHVVEDNYLSVNCGENSCFLPPISPTVKPESVLPTNVRQYLMNLKSSVGFLCNKKCKHSYSNTIFNKTWEKVVNKERRDLRNIISRRLLKLASYEKDLTEKFLSIIAQNSVQKQCYSEVESRIIKARKSAVSVNISNASYDNDDIDRSDIIGTKEGENDDQDENDVETYFNTVKQRYIFGDYVKYCRSELKRTVELHKKLYAEKLKLQFERHYAICLKTLHDITDLAIKRSEYKRIYHMDVPPFMWSDWKCLFHHEQPIFDVINDIENLCFLGEPDTLSLIIELVRQGILNINNLEMYLDVQKYWDVFSDGFCDLGLDVYIEKAHPETQKYTSDHESQIFLGYIVHRLLEMKYPLPSQPTPADIPKYLIRAVVNGLDDASTIHTFKNLLAKAKVLVIDINSAVNFFLQSYKDKLNNEIDSYVLDTELTEIETEEEVPEKQFIADSTQTTDSLFETCDTINLEEDARIGHVIFSSMISGSELPFVVLVDVVVQYIKHFKDDIKGWVLVNFPCTLYHASVIEYALSGKKFPYKLEEGDAFSSSSDCRSSVTMKEVLVDESLTMMDVEVKVSKIVPNPRTYNVNDTFKSYFTIYITTVKGVPVETHGVPGRLSEEFTGSHSESTLLLEHPEKEGVPPLHQFYHEQGIGFDFIYETFDAGTLKLLGYVILLYFSEDSKLQKLPEDLFSEEIIHKFEPSSQLKWLASASSLDESGVFKSLKDQTSSGAVNVTDEQDDVSNGNEESNESKEETIWEYADYPIMDTAMIALATFWENIETLYLNKIKEIFFLRRHNTSSLIPYIAFITKYMNCYQNRKDDRQNIVSEFLNAYNSLPQILRLDYEMKNELHLRVVELKEELIGLCKDKRDEVEQMRTTIINQNWMYQEMVLSTNLYIYLLQTEIERCLTTLEFVQDYYLAMLQNYNSQPLPSIVLTTIDIFPPIQTDSEEEESHSEFSSVNENDENQKLYSAVINRLLNYSELGNTPSPLYDLLSEKADDSLKRVLEIKSQIENVITNNEAGAIKKHKDIVANVKRNLESQKKIQKKGTPELQTEKMPDAITEDEGEKKEISIKNMFVEWRTIVKNEIERLQFRIDLIKIKANSEFVETEALMGNKFVEFYFKLNERFEGELSCISNICYLFQVAIEEKSPINAQLFFVRDKFYAVHNPIEVEVPQIKYPAALEEMLLEESFTIKQLDAIRNRLYRIAPQGIINREAFITFLQNIVSYSSDEKNIKLLPNIWSKLDRNELEILFQKLYGNFSIVEWRDFLLYCLDLPYPITEDVVDARLQFIRYDMEENEFITYENYMNTTLWFERELPENPLLALRNILAKEFIFSLFENSKGKMNYISLLLTFCRDVDPKVGFGKGLSLILGRCVIVYSEDLYLEHILTDHINTDQKVAIEIINNIIDDVVSNAMTGDKEIMTGEKETNELINNSESSSSVETDNDIGPAKLKSMYHQFFRRHSVLQWTSMVPNAIVITLISVTYYAFFIPHHVFVSPDIYKVLKEHIEKYNDKDIFIPEFVSKWWVEHIFYHVHKFNAFSIKNVIKEIILDRAPSLDPSST